METLPLVALAWWMLFRLGRSVSAHAIYLVVLVTTLFVGRYTSGQDILDVKYQLEEETEVGSYVGNVKRDSNLGRYFDADTLSRLQFRFLKQQQLTGFAMEAPTGIIRTSETDRPGGDLQGSRPVQRQDRRRCPARRVLPNHPRRHRHR